MLIVFFAGGSGTKEVKREMGTRLEKGGHGKRWRGMVRNVDAPLDGNARSEIGGIKTHKVYSQIWAAWSEIGGIKTHKGYSQR